MRVRLKAYRVVLVPPQGFDSKTKGLWTEYSDLVLRVETLQLLGRGPTWYPLHRNFCPSLSTPEGLWGSDSVSDHPWGLGQMYPPRILGYQLSWTYALDSHTEFAQNPWLNLGLKKG